LEQLMIVFFVRHLRGVFIDTERSIDSVGAVDDADMFRMPATNGNCESPTPNTATTLSILSLLSLTGLEVKWFWGCYFWRRCNGAGMKTMARRETFTPYYRKDPTSLCR
jgi:hypothetical protein